MKTRWIPALVAIAAVVYLFTALRPLPEPGSTPDTGTPAANDQPKFHLNAAGELPLLAGGRIKPLDTVARTSLLSLCNKQTVVDRRGRALTPVEWLLEVMARPERADDIAVFRIDNPDVLGLLGREQKADEKLFTFAALQPNLPKIQEQNEHVQTLKDTERTAFDRAIAKLYNSLLLYQKLKNSLRPADAVKFSDELGGYLASIPAGIEAAKNLDAGQPHDEVALNKIAEFLTRYDSMAKAAVVYTAWPLSAETPRDQWISAGQSLVETARTKRLHPAVPGWSDILSGWSAQSPAEFNTAVEKQAAATQAGGFGDMLQRGQIEARFNAFEPFYQCMNLYVLAFILAMGSWMVWQEPLRRSAFALIIVAFIVHTLALGLRMWLQGRPPVTNLYSSAIFVGWAGVLVSIVLERLFRDGLGAAAAGLAGFCSLLIAHNLATDGDTMEMMRAVLDSNFWLATHVVTVTLGYSATFLAGILASFYIIRGVLTPSLEAGTARTLGQMVYGVICGATLLSFVGTILGGIWADQSWGRFWGWDPKENGALLIVLWNAMILHARWGGLVRERGVMLLAVIGNIITSFSWFGVNLLGIGLHSYGWMEEGFRWLMVFMLSQAIIITLGLFPLPTWRSAERMKPKAKPGRDGDMTRSQNRRPQQSASAGQR